MGKSKRNAFSLEQNKQYYNSRKHSDNWANSGTKIIQLANSDMKSL